MSSADLKVVPLPLRSESVVAMARDLLAQAEAGQVQVLAVVGVMTDGCILEGYTSHKDIKPFAVIGALEVLKNRVIQHEVDL